MLWLYEVFRTPTSIHGVTEKNCTLAPRIIQGVDQVTTGCRDNGPDLCSGSPSRQYWRRISLAEGLASRQPYCLAWLRDRRGVGRGYTHAHRQRASGRDFDHSVASSPPMEEVDERLDFGACPMPGTFVCDFRYGAIKPTFSKGGHTQPSDWPRKRGLASRNSPRQSRDTAWAARLTGHVAQSAVVQEVCWNELASVRPAAEHGFRHVRDRPTLLKPGRWLGCCLESAR
jgi:hypothetical protein